MSLPNAYDSTRYRFEELVRNNCSCCASDKACDICDIEKQIALALKEWLIQERHWYSLSDDDRRYLPGIDKLLEGFKK